MKAKGFRAGLIALVVAVVMMAGAGNAWACFRPTFDLDVTSARAGDTVPFTLSHTQLGATFTVAVEGYVVVPDGEDTTAAQGYRGTFTMPNRGGSTRSLLVKGEMRHLDDSADHMDDGPWSDEPALQFIRPGPPGPAPPAREPNSVPAPTDAPERQRPPMDSKPTTPGGGSPSTGSGPAGPAGPGSPGPPSSPVSPADPSGSPRPEVSAAVEAAADSPSLATAQEQSRRPAAAAPVRRPRQVERRVGTSLTRPDETPALPATVLVGIALIVLIGAAFAMVRLLSRGGAAPGADRAPTVPPWIPPDVRREAWARDVLIEAELQELIAEERARELAADMDGAPAAPG
jgi:hypothetical protein